MMAIALYSSRIVLRELGETDYGVYSLVGGIVALFTFLNSSMSHATSRFLNVEMARENSDRLHETFRAAMIVHIVIALIVLILAETVGLWIVGSKLNITPDRHTAAIWVYQLSVAAAMISITQVPYNALITAHERMDIYAKAEIVSAFLKLGVAFLLIVMLTDLLIFYALLIFIIQLGMALFYRIYCIKHYSESKFKWHWHKQIGKSLLGFSGWNLYSTFCYAGRRQGTSILLNIFGSTAVNAAAGLAETINSMIEQLSSNMLLAARPQVVSQCAIGNYRDMIKLLTEINLLANCLYLMVAIPYFADIEYVLSLWLENVPAHLVDFSKLSIIIGFLLLNNNLLNLGLQATGHIVLTSIVSGTISLLSLPVVWVAFWLGGSLNWAYIIIIITIPLQYGVNCYCMKRDIMEFRALYYTSVVILRTAVIALLPIVSIWLLHCIVDESFYRIMIAVVISISFISVSAITFGLPRESRAKVRHLLLSKLSFGQNK